MPQEQLELFPPEPEEEETPPQRWDHIGNVIPLSEQVEPGDMFLDGNIVMRGENGQRYRLKVDADGNLVCERENQ
jgi:hypothetical protein